MFKNIFLILSFIFFLFSCKKKNDTESNVLKEADLPAPYDTVAIDSFSAGTASHQMNTVRLVHKDSIKESSNQKKR